MMVDEVTLIVVSVQQLTWPGVVLFDVKLFWACGC